MAQLQLKNLDFVESVSWETEQLKGGYYATATAAAAADAAAVYDYGVNYETAYGTAAGAAAGAAAAATAVNGSAYAGVVVSVGAVA
jgi:hypothetical protein